MRTFLLLILVLLCLPSCQLLDSDNGPLNNGLYKVERRGPTLESVQPLASGECTAIFDYQQLNPEVESALEYVVFVRADYVPLKLAEAPETVPAGDGKDMLNVRLTPEAGKAFEEFTRRHLNQAIAVVVGNRVVTLHKVREVITGGRVQVTRCRDNACEMIRLQLLEE